MIIPAGVAHRLLDDFKSSFKMVGSYPKGKKWDMCYGESEDDGNHGRISNLGWFHADPLYGSDAPHLNLKITGEGPSKVLS